MQPVLCRYRWGNGEFHARPRPDRCDDARRSRQKRGRALGRPSSRDSSADVPKDRQYKALVCERSIELTPEHNYRVIM